jgi:hypothetical protein
MQTGQEWKKARRSARAASFLLRASAAANRSP